MWYNEGTDKQRPGSALTLPACHRKVRFPWISSIPQGVVRSAASKSPSLSSANPMHIQADIIFIAKRAIRFGTMRIKIASRPKRKPSAPLIRRHSASANAHGTMLPSITFGHESNDGIKRTLISAVLSVVGIIGHTLIRSVQKADCGINRIVNTYDNSAAFGARLTATYAALRSIGTKRESAPMADRLPRMSGGRCVLTMGTAAYAVVSRSH